MDKEFILGYNKLIKSRYIYYLVTDYVQGT